MTALLDEAEILSIWNGLGLPSLTPTDHYKLIHFVARVRNARNVKSELLGWLLTSRENKIDRELATNLFHYLKATGWKEPT